MFKAEKGPDYLPDTGYEEDRQRTETSKLPGRLSKGKKQDHFVDVSVML